VRKNDKPVLLSAALTEAIHKATWHAQLWGESDGTDEEEESAFLSWLAHALFLAGQISDNYEVRKLYE